MVEEARLESVYTPKGYHEFESRSLRNSKCRIRVEVTYFCPNFFIYTYKLL